VGASLLMVLTSGLAVGVNLALGVVLAVLAWRDCRWTSVFFLLWGLVLLIGQLGIEAGSSTTLIEYN